MELAAKRELMTQAAVRRRIAQKENVHIAHQKFSQWCTGDTSFPNDFAEIFTRALDLGSDEQVELALALSYGQKRHRLLRRADL